MKKIATVLIICIILMVLSIGCSNDLNDIVDSDHKEITILIKDVDYSAIKIIFTTVYMYAQRFELETGIKVKFDVVEGNNEDDYAKKVNTKLYLKEGPTLIFISDYCTYEEYIEHGAALNTEGKIPNAKKIYNELLDDGCYFTPIGILHWAVAFNRNATAKLGIDDLKPDLTREDYLKIKKEYFRIKPEYFNDEEYYEFIVPMIYDLEILDERNKKINLNNSRVIQYIKDVRKEIFSGKYILNKNYKYENYYNMIFDTNSKEYNESKTNDYRRLWKSSAKNGLKSLDVGEYIDIKDKIVVPCMMFEKERLIEKFGVIVNKNGKNTDLGMQFVNGLLSNETQLEMYLSDMDTLYPVNKDIEDEIEKIEKEKNINEKAVAIRKYILQQINNGNYKDCTNSRIIQEIKNMIYKDFAKFIFADEAYTDEELSRELEKLEYKYNMWLNE